MTSRNSDESTSLAHWIEPSEARTHKRHGDHYIFCARHSARITIILLLVCLLPLSTLTQCHHYASNCPKSLTPVSLHEISFHPRVPAAKFYSAFLPTLPVSLQTSHLIKRITLTVIIKKKIKCLNFCISSFGGIFFACNISELWIYLKIDTI